MSLQYSYLGEPIDCSPNDVVLFGLSEREVEAATVASRSVVTIAAAAVILSECLRLRIACATGWRAPPLTFQCFSATIRALASSWRAIGPGFGCLSSLFSAASRRIIFARIAVSSPVSLAGRFVRHPCELSRFGIVCRYELVVGWASWVLSQRVGHAAHQFQPRGNSGKQKKRRRQTDDCQ